MCPISDNHGLELQVQKQTVGELNASENLENEFEDKNNPFLSSEMIN